MNAERNTLLIVDDQELNRELLKNAFSDANFDIVEASDGVEATEVVHEKHAVLAAMLLDIVMPHKDGYQVLKELKRDGYLSEFPVVIITGENSTESELKAFDEGAAEMISKPYVAHVLRRRVRNVIELNLHRLHQDELIAIQQEKIRKSNESLLNSLTSIIEYRSLETGQHIVRIKEFTKVLLQNVAENYPEYKLNNHIIDVIVSASSMHDIGKIAIPDHILNKPGRLTPEEFEIMKTHSIKGCEMVDKLNDNVSDKEFIQYAHDICLHHHERWDGNGYPEKQAGDEIPICAQVVGVTDCYDALTNDRVYKKAIPSKHAFEMILNGECGAFLPRLQKCLRNVMGQFIELTARYSDHVTTAL